MSCITSFLAGSVLYFDHNLEDIYPEETYNGQTITRINDSACSGCHAKRVDLSRTKVTEIALNAFYQCRSLTTVILPDTLVDITYDAFRYTEIASLHIPKSLASFDGAFNMCGKLATFTIHAENQNFVVYNNVVYDKGFNKIVRASCNVQFEDITKVLEKIKNGNFSNLML